MSSFLKRDFSIHPPADTPAYKSSIFRSPKQKRISFDNTVTEMTGPTFGHDELGELDNDLIRNFSKDDLPVGERVIVHGRVMDQHARPVPNILVEIWQANAGGRYRHKVDDYLAPLDPNFGGCGRALTGEDGSYSFWTIKPGPYPWPNGANSWRPAHIHFSVFGSGFAQRLITQMYFEGDPLIPLCPIVSTIPDKEAISRLVAKLDMDKSIPFDCLAYQFDIVLRGNRSTVFENKLEGN